MSTHELVAAEVRAQLARNQRSGSDMAAELGWNQMYLWRRLSGKVAFDVNDLAAIAAVLEVPVTSFFPVSGGIKSSRSLTLATAA